MSLVPKQGETELTAQRNETSRTFRNQDGSFRTVVSVAPIHWHNGSSWVDTDCSLVSDDGVIWRTVSTPYTLLWDSASAKLTYRPRSGGELVISLDALDGEGFKGGAQVTQLAGRRLSSQVAPSLQILLHAHPRGVEILKLLEDATAPKSLRWRVVDDGSGIAYNLETTTGRDNRDNIQSRKSDQLNQFRKVEITHSRSASQVVDGKTVYTVEETVTGRTRFTDNVTRARTWVNEITYPVLVDVTVNLGSDNDDGSGYATSYWLNSYSAVKSDRYMGLRFTNVTVPQGATISAATINWNVTSLGGGGTATFKAQNSVNAGAWTHGSANSPATMSTLTNSVAVPVPAGTGARTQSVTILVQDVVSQGSWASGNALRIGCTSVASLTGGGYWFITDYTTAGTGANLDITYTAGGGRTTKNTRAFPLGMEVGMALRL